ncbi:MAG: hypothetical protein J3Q66DRAFT_394169 [Benniella sp.]|nr:MAG: hypothetical protein J3Q66DRAFT_394169 [Benniella sp.]
MGALDKEREQHIEADVPKVVAKGKVGNNGNGTEAPGIPFTDFNADSKACSRTIVQGLENRVPVEVWERIFEHLYPSQLSRVSMVCRTFYDIVGKLPVWPDIYAKAHPGGQNHVIGGIKPVRGKSLNKDFMVHVCGESFQICELCFSVFSGAGVPKDRMASLPLPVHVWRVRAAMKKIEFLPLSSKIGRQDWVVRLCLDCRRKIFEACPESIPRKAKTRWMRDATEYHLTNVDLNMSRKDSCLEETVLMKARFKYGGDIGIQAAAPESWIRAIESMESRLQDICLRQTAAFMDA